MTHIKILFITMLVQGFLAGQLFSADRSDNYEKIDIAGETAKNGIFDPSIEYDKDGKTGYLAYSEIEEPAKVGIAIAKSLDHGKTWKYLLTVNPPEYGFVNYQGKKVAGYWRCEVPSLVYDPDDTGKEWKLMYHKYFTKVPYLDNDRLFIYGWIAYKYASSPEGPWSIEHPLFGAGSFPLKPYHAKYDLNSLHSDLENMLAYTEPGLLCKDSVLYLALQGHSKDSSSVFLLSSSNHGRTWKYRGMLADAKDAELLGYKSLTAPSLAEEKGRIFLLLSPFSPLPRDHDGTYVFEFEDLSKGKLKRDKDGRLIASKYLEPSVKGGNVNAGESDYDEHNTAGGIIMPQIDMNKAIWEKDIKFLNFGIYNTFENLTE